jgi:hypothetical protein
MNNIILTSTHDNYDDDSWIDIYTSDNIKFGTVWNATSTLSTFGCKDELVLDDDYINGFENTNFHEYEGIYTYHGGNDYTIPNGVFGSSKNHPLINYIFDQIDILKWGWYGPSWMGNMVREYFNLPHECIHELLIPKLESINTKYYLFSEFENNNFKHYALYSWSPENRKNFESGNINYLK